MARMILAAGAGLALLRGGATPVDAALQGLKGVACVDPLFSEGLNGCVFTNDNTKEVCWFDIASREAFLLPGDYDRPHEVSITRDGALIVVADWAAGKLVKIEAADAARGGSLARATTVTSVNAAATDLPDLRAREGFWDHSGPDAVEVSRRRRSRFGSLGSLGSPGAAAVVCRPAATYRAHGRGGRLSGARSWREATPRDGCLVVLS